MKIPSALLFSFGDPLCHIHQPIPVAIHVLGRAADLCDGLRDLFRRCQYLDSCGNRKSMYVRDEPEVPLVYTNPAGNPMVNPKTGSTV